LDDSVSAFKETLEMTLKDSAVKQETERLAELQNAALRCIVVLNRRASPGTSSSLDVIPPPLSCPDAPPAPSHHAQVLQHGFQRRPRRQVWVGVQGDAAEHDALGWGCDGHRCLKEEERRRGARGLGAWGSAANFLCCKVCFDTMIVALGGVAASADELGRVGVDGKESARL
jgi:hypothetical protein